MERTRLLRCGQLHLISTVLVWSILDQMIASSAVGISENRVFENSKAHTMGVCCISPSPSDPYSIFTGSYDETLRVWDTRSILGPVTEISLSLGGGVWRTKHHPSLSGVVLAACMHNGFAVVVGKVK